MPTRLLRTPFLCTAVALAACSRSSDAGRADVTAASTVEHETAPPEAPVLLDTAGAWRPEERDLLPSTQIYYTLTDYDWYAHGEPLVHDGVAYTANGMPVAASLADMTKQGEYGDVAYYTLRDDTEPRLYVPVFEGYWLSFRRDTMSKTEKAAGPPNR